MKCSSDFLLFEHEGEYLSRLRTVCVDMIGGSATLSTLVWTKSVPEGRNRLWARPTTPSHYSKPPLSPKCDGVLIEPWGSACLSSGCRVLVGRLAWLANCQPIPSLRYILFIRCGSTWHGGMRRGRAGRKNEPLNVILATSTCLASTLSSQHPRPPPCWHKRLMGGCRTGRACQEPEVRSLHQRRREGLRG